VAAAHPIDQHEIYVTTSIGISLYPQDGQDAETLFKNADSAMYEAKKNGRQSYRFFGENSGVPTEDRYSIEQGLRHALEQNEFTLYYQPKIDLKSGAITGAEALLRWTHPTLGKVPPEQFIPVAEDSGLILPIGAWVIHQACMQASAWAKQGLCCRTMAVNVSAVQFMADSFLKGLFADLEETGLDPKSLELEMTESVLMSHPELTGPILKTLREYGVRVSVDDFGTGYSSLSYLQQFSLDALKIDRSFVHKIGDSANDATIVSSIISMGQSLNLRVIAEGVETAADVTFLKTQHCDEAQGYFFSYPVPAEPFACLLQVH
jgi:EAL domain-containing protein (putative c-di-GMP-specific phosphodiesterase class I)